MLLGACNPARFHIPQRALPEAGAIVSDPVPTPAAQGGSDPRSVAKRAIQASDENALRLLIAWCSYDNVRRSYAGLKGESDEPRCVALRTYLGTKA